MIDPACADQRSPEIDIQRIMEMIPHRHPFLMIDKVVDVVANERATGIKNVSIDEYYFQGHFPGHPVMPGVLQVEAMAQVASILMSKTNPGASGIGYFMSADEVKFRKPVVPGDTLIIEAELLRAKGTIGKASCRCLVNGEVTSEGTLMFAFVLQ